MSQTLEAHRTLAPLSVSISTDVEGTSKSDIQRLAKLYRGRALSEPLPPGMCLGLSASFVRGVKAKALAAERAGLNMVALPEENGADLPEDLKIEACFITHVEELWELAFASDEQEVLSR